jgi:outer membrane translocation and assembly module TamA
LVELGYAHAKVDSFVRRTDARTADICLWVEAGPAVRVQSVVFEGRAKLDEDQLETALRNAGSEANLPGGMLDPAVLEVQLLHATAAYYDAGMVNVRLGAPELRYSADRTRVAIHVSVQEGDVFRVGKVTFAVPMNANAARYGAVLGFGQGDVFSRSKVMAAIEPPEPSPGGRGSRVARAGHRDRSREAHHRPDVSGLGREEFGPLAPLDQHVVDHPVVLVAPLISPEHSYLALACDVD